MRLERPECSQGRWALGVQGKNGRRAWGGSQPGHVQRRKSRLGIRLVSEVCRQPLQGFQKEKGLHQ